MTLYIFYCRGADGVPLSIHTADLASDSAAFVRAHDVMAEHSSCDVVEVFESDRNVTTAVRRREAARA